MQGSPVVRIIAWAVVLLTLAFAGFLGVRLASSELSTASPAAVPDVRTDSNDALSNSGQSHPQPTEAPSEREHAAVTVLPASAPSDGSAPPEKAVTGAVPPPPKPAELIVDGQLDGSKAMGVLYKGFDRFLDELHLESEGDDPIREIRDLYALQIEALLAGYEVELSRIECGSRLCAVELLGADPDDPFANNDIDSHLPREARFEVTLPDDEADMSRRFIFSIDPDVDSIYVPRRRDKSATEGRASVSL